MKEITPCYFSECKFSYLERKLDMLFELVKSVVIILGKQLFYPKILNFMKKTLFCYYLCPHKPTVKKPIYKNLEFWAWGLGSCWFLFNDDELKYQAVRFLNRFLFMKLQMYSLFSNVTCIFSFHLSNPCEIVPRISD